ncbi:MAG TPA: cytochrome c [Opitutus sp.]|nr:cytochrome c [Opitutus sp.]
MKKVLKFLGYAVAALVAIIVIALASVYAASGAKLRQKFPVTAESPAVPAGAEAIATGHHIAQTRGCFECHGTDLAGATVFDNPAMGRADGPNITRGAGGLPAGWTDGDFERAIRHGVMPDGRGLFLMPSEDFSSMSRADMGALIAYIKSVPPVNKPSGPVSPGPVARALMLAGKIKLAAEVIDHAHVQPDEVTPGITVEYGKYLAVGCTGCHGRNFSGGKIDIGPPDWPPAANLTPRGDLAKWTEADFMATIRTGRKPDGQELSPVMPRAFGNLTDVELKALWAFLRTLPPAETGVQ